MKISIITVCYNAEKTLKETIESVLKQDYSNYEYLIIDGLSTDNTLNIIKKYEPLFNGKMKYISEKDKGIYDAMNKGIALATGDVIGLINSDDLLANNMVFTKIINSIDNYDGVYGNLLFVDEKGRKNRIFRPGKYSKKIGWYPPHPTLYLKKQVYQQYGNFNPKYKIAADYDFMIRIVKKIKLNYIDEYLVYMKTGGASTHGLNGYYKNFKDSLMVLKDNKVPFSFLINIIRIFKTIYQGLLAKVRR